jgi:hypothetical protein
MYVCMYVLHTFKNIWCWPQCYPSIQERSLRACVSIDILANCILSRMYHPIIIINSNTALNKKSAPFSKTYDLGKFSVTNCVRLPNFFISYANLIPFISYFIIVFALKYCISTSKWNNQCLIKMVKFRW